MGRKYGVCPHQSRCARQLPLRGSLKGKGTAPRGEALRARNGAPGASRPTKGGGALDRKAEHGRRFPVSGNFDRGFPNGSGSGADGAILILHIIRKQNRQGLFLGVWGPILFTKRWPPQKRKNIFQTFGARGGRTMCAPTGGGGGAGRGREASPWGKPLARSGRWGESTAFAPISLAALASFP